MLGTKDSAKPQKAPTWVRIGMVERKHQLGGITDHGPTAPSLIICLTMCAIGVWDLRIKGDRQLHRSIPNDFYKSRTMSASYRPE
jgi:hypothetical protein